MAASDEQAPILQQMYDAPSSSENNPTYKALLDAKLLTTKYKRQDLSGIFENMDRVPNTSQSNDIIQRIKYCWCVPVVGCFCYNCTHSEFFVPAGHIGLLLDESQQYIFAQPGMHNIASCFVKHSGTQQVPDNGCLQHGNRTVVVVEEGFVGLAFDNGQPVLLPPGIHAWSSDTLRFKKSVAMNQNVIQLGPYTVVTVDQGYAAVTSNNGRQMILEGGRTHLLDHKNWRFEYVLALKIQTDDLESIQATSADNIIMRVTSTVAWRVVDPVLAATMAADTMKGGKATDGVGSADLRKDVLKQAIASLASFIGGVNYSDSFHVAAHAQGLAAARSAAAVAAVQEAVSYEPDAESVGKLDNPLYDMARMGDAVNHANATTMSYGVRILSINILSAVPVDEQLTKALACGAVASAEALQAETAARGNAKAARIDAEAAASRARIEADGLAQASVIRARAEAEAARLVADGNKAAADLLSTSRVAVELAKMDKSAAIIGKQDKFFFGQEPSYMSSLVLKGDAAKAAGIFG